MSDAVHHRRVVIEPRGSSSISTWAGVWEHRRLLYHLIRRDIRVRYRKTFLAVVWVILPMFSTAAFFAGLAGVGRMMNTDGDLPYLLFNSCAFVPWIFFSQALNRTAASIESNGPLVSRVFFPRLVLPISAVAGGVVDFLAGLVFLLILSAAMGRPPALTAVFALPLAGLAALLALGIGSALAVLTVRWGDLRFGVTLLVQFWMFATPIVYPRSVLPERLRPWAILNPMTGIVEGFRSAVYGLEWDPAALSVSVIAAAVLLPAGVAVFRNGERDLADLL